jgi:hypothetical protein
MTDREFSILIVSIWWIVYGLYRLNRKVDKLLKDRGL